MAVTPEATVAWSHYAMLPPYSAADTGGNRLQRSAAVIAVACDVSDFVCTI